MHVIDICRVVKRRLKDASLSAAFAALVQVTTITDLLEQGVPLEDVQRPGPPRRTRAPPASTTAATRRSRATMSSGFRFE